MHRKLLVSDVDGTLLGDDEALARFVRWYESRVDQIALVYSSGRFCESIVDSIEQTALPAPTAIIGGVGTEIYGYPHATPVRGWQEQFERWDAGAVCRVAARHSCLEPQPEEFQSTYKRSYFAYDAPASFLGELEQELLGAGVSAQIVYSSNRDLDVLPLPANKGTAIVFLAAHWKVPAERTLVSGDSANDLAMFQQGFWGIVVGNAHRALKELSDANVYQARAEFADGVVEGLDYWLGRI